MPNKGLWGRHAEEARMLEPVIAKMNPEQAHKLSVALDSLIQVADAMRTLSGEIEDSASLEDKDIVAFTEGLDAADTETLRTWLKKKADEVQEVYEAIPLNQRDLFKSLSTTAIDVYYDAERAKEEAEEANAN